MAKFWMASSQAKELGDEAKVLTNKNKELEDELFLKKGERIRLDKELTRLQGIEKELRNQEEELKTDSIEKETCINHFEVKCQELTLSLENAKKEAIATFVKSDDFTNCLDQHYVAGYEDFRSDTKEAYLGMNFDSFKVPTATESTLLQPAPRMLTSWTMLQLIVSKMMLSPPRTTQSLGRMPSVVYLSNFYI